MGKIGKVEGISMVEFLQFPWEATGMNPTVESIGDYPV